MTKSYKEIVSAHSQHASPAVMHELSVLTSDYIERPTDKEAFLKKVEALLCPFLDEDMARHFVSEFENADGSRGEHWSYGTILDACDRLGVPRSSELYGPWDLYAAVNMMYSDLYDSHKSSETYVKDGYRFVNDKDFPIVGKMKWYLMAKHDLAE